MHGLRQDFWRAQCPAKLLHYHPFDFTRWYAADLAGILAELDRICVDVIQVPFGTLAGPAWRERTPLR